jgi:hypothetical protein
LLRQETVFSPNPRFAFATLTRNAASSDYHSLQLQFHRRFSTRLSALVSYTWAHSIDNTSDETERLPSAELFNPDSDRGPSDFDIRHALSAVMTLKIPRLGKPNSLVGAIFRDFGFDMILVANSSRPFSVVAFRALEIGVFNVRPDLVGGIPLYIDDPLAPGGRRLNNTPLGPNQVGPFRIPGEPRQGTLGRNTLRGFPLYQADIALRRRFQVSEHVGLQMKAELFNVFNHPNFASPVGHLGSVSGDAIDPDNSFGRSTSMLGRRLGTGGVNAGLSPLYQIGGPRSIQLSLRLEF